MPWRELYVLTDDWVDPASGVKIRKAAVCVIIQDLGRGWVKAHAGEASVTFDVERKLLTPQERTP